MLSALAAAVNPERKREVVPKAPIRRLSVRAPASVLKAAR